MTEAERATLRYAIPTNEMLALEIMHLRELRSMDQKALELQAKEYERRMSLLNGEWVRVAEIAKSNISAPTYEFRHKELENRIDVKTDALAVRVVMVERNIWLATGGLIALISAWKIAEHFLK